jgi:hypothetical protein
MKSIDIVSHRLLNQQIAETKLKKPQEIVSWLGAMQSQEWAHAKWAIGLRLPGSTEADVEKAYNDGKILRTHMMRPTWHFVTPEDIRWMQEATAHRVHAISAYMMRKVELNATILKKAIDTIVKELEGGKLLKREDLREALEKKKITGDGVRIGYIMMHAELECILCSGPREGKQFTYALLDERAPKARSLGREKGLAELAKRYFTSRSPATVQDFSWWSGLSVKEAREAVELTDDLFEKQKIGDAEYIFHPQAAKLKSSHQKTFLMPDYDEYGISYKDRSAIMETKVAPQMINGRPATHALVVDGTVQGSWQRTAGKPVT